MAPIPQSKGTRGRDEAIHRSTSEVIYQDLPSASVDTDICVGRYEHLRRSMQIVKIVYNVLPVSAFFTNFASANALVAELVDAPDLGSGVLGREGSSPFRRTIQNPNCLILSS